MTRFDTWRKHFLNSDLFRGRYTEGYLEYLRSLSKEETSAYILEDKDMSEGEVNTKNLANLVRRHGIKLLIISLKIKNTFVVFLSYQIMVIKFINKLHL